MCRVIELHVEAFSELCREPAGRWRNRLQIFVTDSAHRTFGVRKLVQMTADARIVPGKFEVERTTLALMARSAFELLVFGNFMRKRFKGRVGNTRRGRNRRVRRSYRRVDPFRLPKTACRKDRERDQNKKCF